MVSETSICNKALQRLGAKRITDRTENSINAKACDAAFDQIRDEEFQRHPWSFAITRATLAEDATAPTWGRSHSYVLPSDFIRLYLPYPEDREFESDWKIELGKVVTDDAAPLEVRYIARVDDPTRWPPLFVKAVALQLALEICEEVTGSNTKRQLLQTEYAEAISAARAVDDIQAPQDIQVEDDWITCRT